MIKVTIKVYTQQYIFNSIKCGSNKFNVSFFNCVIKLLRGGKIHKTHLSAENFSINVVLSMVISNIKIVMSHAYFSPLKTNFGLLDLSKYQRQLPIYVLKN